MFEWKVPPKILLQPGEDVHLWRFWLDQPAEQVAKFWQTLSADEQRRANRFHLAYDRNHYIAGRGTVRELLARYLEITPQAVKIEYTQYGKPVLVSPHNPSQLHFNLAHSSGLGLLAIGQNQQLGIDLELIKASNGLELVAERFFSAQEVATLRALSSSQKLEGFFNCWTRKEAFLKATSEGLNRPLDSFTVSIKPGEVARLLYVRDNPSEVNRWHIQSLQPAPNYIAALITEKQSNVCTYLAGAS